MSRAPVVLSCLAALVLAPSLEARAHGRPPEFLDVVRPPDATTRLAAATTFGLLLSNDGGARWRWICEEGIGYAPTQEPKVVWTRSGLLVGTGDGLFRSDHRGCAFVRHPTLSMSIADLHAVPGRPARIFASTAVYDERNQIHRSVDDGRTFAPVFDAGRAFLLSVRAGIDGRVYASGWFPDESRGVIFRSDDGGDSWSEQALAGSPAWPLYLLAVRANGPDLLFARATDQDDALLLRSQDGGVTFTVVWRGPTAIVGLVIEEDGTVALGTRSGLFVSRDEGRTFAAAGVLRAPTCLTRTTPGETFACSLPADDGFILARARGTGSPFLPVTSAWSGLEGVVTGCDAQAPVPTTCAPHWPVLTAQLGLPSEMAPAARPRASGCQLAGGRGSAWWPLFCVLVLGRRRRFSAAQSVLASLPCSSRPTRRRSR